MTEQEAEAGGVAEGGAEGGAGLRVEDEFQPDETGPSQGEEQQVWYIKEEEQEAGEVKIIRIETNSGGQHSKPAVSGLKGVTGQPARKVRVVASQPEMQTVWLCPDRNCKLKLPSRAILETHIKLCHTRQVESEDTADREEEDEEEDDLDGEDEADHLDDLESKKTKVRNKPKKFSWKECHICGFITDQSTILKKHMRTEHKESEVFSCSECSVQVSRKYHLIRNMTNISIRVLCTTDPPDIFSCKASQK